MKQENCIFANVPFTITNNLVSTTVEIGTHKESFTNPQDAFRYGLTMAPTVFYELYDKTMRYALYSDYKPRRVKLNRAA